METEQRWATVHRVRVGYNSGDLACTQCVYADFPGGSDGKESACSAGDSALIPGLGCILAWRIPWTEVPGGLQSTGSQTVGHD